MNVSVDGGTATAVNTYTPSSTNNNRVIVWQRSLSAGTHTVKIVNAGSSGHARVDVDTLILGPSWVGEAPHEYSGTW